MKRLLKWCSYATVVVILTAVLTEFGLRRWGDLPTAGIHTVSEEDFTRIPGMYQPNQDLTEVSHPKLAYQMHINSLGFRGPEVERVKPAGVVRILCLGDSGTFGEYVQEDETLTMQLESLLRLKQLPVEVINGGVHSSTIVDELEFLRRDMELQPDIVVLTFTENDITDLLTDPPQYVAFERNRQVKSRPGVKQVYELVRDTATFNFILKLRGARAAQTAKAGTPAVAQAEVRRDNAPYEAALLRYADHLKTMKNYLEERQVPFVFNVFPTHHRIGADTMTDATMRAQLERVEALAKSLGIRTVEVLPTFLRSGLGKQDLYLLPYDGHSNKNGYRLQALALLPSLHELIQDRLTTRTWRAM
jgi:lysophospholipase L1-like esterase